MLARAHTNIITHTYNINREKERGGSEILEIDQMYYITLFINNLKKVMDETIFQYRSTLYINE